MKFLLMAVSTRRLFLNNEYFYEVWKLGYDSEWRSRQDEELVGRFDRYHEARDSFLLLCENDALKSCAKTAFRIEKCINCTDGSVSCIDIIDEATVDNPWLK